jgi:hypothetical protein
VRVLGRQALDGIDDQDRHRRPGQGRERAQVE